MRSLLIATSFVALSGCTMVCGPASSDGYTYCQPAASAPSTYRPRINYSEVPKPGPGYAPAYPDYAPYQSQRWVTDTPHYNVGDE